MPGIGRINLKVVVMDTDFYALQSINGYLAWDRRTRVTHLTTSLNGLWSHLNDVNHAELPDVIVLDAEHLGTVGEVKHIIEDLIQFVPNVLIICLAQFLEPELVISAYEAGARAFLQKSEVRLHIAWAICYSMDEEFLISPEIARDNTIQRYAKFPKFAVLPEQREYPEMTDRIKQAINLCVIEGMPAHLAADEMGISLHTIRGYIKDGYRILETYDETEYPVDMTPQERAFMRFTALATSQE